MIVIVNGTSTIDETLSFTYGTPINAFGIYADLRDSGGTTLGGYSDLSIETVPEPAPNVWPNPATWAMGYQYYRDINYWILNGSQTPSGSPIKSSTAKAS